MTIVYHERTLSRMSEKLRALGSEDFEREVVSGGRPAMVEFGATWCAPCRQLAPLFEDLATEYGDEILVAAVDVDEAQQIAIRYGVRAVPTVILFRDGEVVDRLIGVQPRAAYVERIESRLRVAA